MADILSASDDLVTGDDGLKRPPWAASSELLREYYDHEWGMPVPVSYTHLTLPTTPYV